MTYLYLIQKKEYFNTNIFKIGLLKSIENIDKTNKVILLLNDQQNLVNLNNLKQSMMTKFTKFNSKNYFIGNENQMIYFLSNYYKNLYLPENGNYFDNTKSEIIKKLCLSSLSDNEKYEKLSNLCNKKVQLRNIIFDSNISSMDKHQKICELLSNIQPFNFGDEDISIYNNKNIEDLLVTSSFVNLLYDYIQTVHENDNFPENKNIKSDENGLKLFLNNEWVDDDKNIYKVLMNSMQNMYMKIYSTTMKNMHDDFLYTKGLLVLNKINCLLK
jgi:hypothetical protein